MYVNEFINAFITIIILVLILSIYKWYYWKKECKNARYLIKIYEIRLNEIERKRKRYYGK